MVPKDALIVRKAASKDAEAVATMAAAAAKDDGLEPPALDAELIRAHALGPRALIDVWVAEDAVASEIKGCAITHTGYDIGAACATLVIAVLYVAPDARNAGVARMLLAAVAERTMDIGGREIIITTGIDNAGARAFFAAVGATERRAAMFVLGRDAVEWLAQECD